MTLSIRFARQIALGAAVALLAAPVAAETYLISLKGGGTIQSRYQPQESSWDAGTVLFMTETGNWIGVQKSEIVSVEQENNLRGFGFVINPTTIALGWAPNDLEDPANAETKDIGARLLQALGGGSAEPAPARAPYTIQQGVSTEATQGIPVSFVPGGQAYGGDQPTPQAPNVELVVVPPSESPNR